MIRKTLLVLCFALTACVSSEPISWYKDGVDQATYEQDHAECAFEGSKYPPATYGIGVDRKVYIMCMQAHGYQQMSQ